MYILRLYIYVHTCALKHTFLWLAESHVYRNYNILFSIDFMGHDVLAYDTLCLLPCDFLAWNFLFVDLPLQSRQRRKNSPLEFISLSNLKVSHNDSEYFKVVFTGRWWLFRVGTD